jgi:hypothetical protein
MTSTHSIEKFQLEFTAPTDVDVIPINLHFIASHTIAPAVSRMAVPDIKGEVMPRTDNHTSLAPPLGKRPAFMRAYIVDRVKVSVDVKHRDGLLVYLHNLHLTRRYILYAGHTYKTIHEYVFFCDGKRFTFGG